MTPGDVAIAPPRSAAPIDCETTVRRLWDFLDGRLPPWAHDEVEAHLAACALCPPHFAFARAIQAALAAEGAQAAGPPAAGELLRARVRAALRHQAEVGAPEPDRGRSDA